MNVGGILTDLAIREAVDKGDIAIDPFDARQLNPASYDLRLGDGVAVYDAWVKADWVRDATGVMRPAYDEPLAAKDRVLDAKDEPRIDRFQIGSDGIVLRPDVGYLMHTAERIATKRFVPVLDGKSSLARLFVSVHETAGYGDAGYDGQYTLEVTVKHPIRLYAGMRIAQIRFHTMHGEVGKLYSGNYTGETSRGAVASRAWKQFEKDAGK